MKEIGFQAKKIGQASEILKEMIEDKDCKIFLGMAGAMVPGGMKNIILDLSNSRYCDSSGLSAILVANRLCKNAKGTFVLTGLNEAVERLITISQLDTVLNIVGSIDEAVKMISE